MAREHSTGDTEQSPVKKPGWIARFLQDVPVVEWDRFTVSEREGYQYVSVYGWIDRDQDEYKDFVWARFWPANEAVEYTTSSDQYSEYMQAEWFGEDSLDNHNECRRVEHAFDIENAIELHEDQSLNAYTDGGADTSGISREDVRLSTRDGHPSLEFGDCGIQLRTAVDGELITAEQDNHDGPYFILMSDDEIVGEITPEWYSEDGDSDD